MTEDEERVTRRLKEEKYKKKLEKLLHDADTLDKRVIKGTKRLIRSMRERVLAKTAEAAASSRSGIEPSWGPYWAEKLRQSYNGVLEEIGNQFQQDLSRYSVQAIENGSKIADEGLKFANPGINVNLDKIDPEQLKIASSFSPDLITSMKKAQLDSIGKEVALSLSLREDSGGLISRLAVDLDKGPWRTSQYRAEIIGRTEVARVQELGRELRSRQLQRANPELNILYQWLVVKTGPLPCKLCALYDGNVYDLEGNPVIIGKGKRGGKRPDLPVHPNCRCTLVPFIPGLSIEPEQEEQIRSDNYVRIFWSQILEAWSIVFESQNTPNNVVRLPRDTPNAILEFEAKRLASLSSMNPDTLEIEIERPSSLSKPATMKQMGISEAKKDSRWSGIPKSYHSWRGMKDRCCNPSDKDYPRYGGRGIKICSAWINDYQQFVKDMGEPPDPSYSLDRIDNDGDYKPSNCKWASKSDQAKNRSTPIRTR